MEASRIFCDACYRYYLNNKRQRPQHLFKHKWLPKKLKQQQLINKFCFRCSTTETRKWYKDLYGHDLCKACYQYLKRHGNHRPERLFHQKNKQPNAAMLFVEKNVNRCCSNCSSEFTCCWHYNADGSDVCNACFSYNLRHKIDRPSKLFSKQSKKSGVKSDDVQSRFCNRCATNNTTKWRKDIYNNDLCSACGSYFHKYNEHRPERLFKKDRFM